MYFAHYHAVLDKFSQNQPMYYELYAVFKFILILKTN